MPDILERTRREKEIALLLAGILSANRGQLAAGLDAPLIRAEIERGLVPIFADAFRAGGQASQIDLNFATAGLVPASDAWANHYSKELASTIAARLGSEFGGHNYAPDELYTRIADLSSPKLWGGLAATEITRAAVSGSEYAAAAFGVAMLSTPTAIWMTSLDDRVCSICEPLDGLERIAWEMEAPLGPPLHPNCRCWLQFST